MRLLSAGLCAFLLLFPAFSPAFFDDRPSFDEWLAAFAHQAEEAGISSQTVEAAFSGLQPVPEVVETDRKQPEKTRTFADYRQHAVTDKRVEQAQEQWEENRSLLRKISRKYSVPAPVILSLWGMESAFGERQGSYPVIASLATLAYDGRRSAFFRQELMQALWILEEENMAPEDLTGSWAGAMGQTQFMPSSYRKYAVDFDGDGKRDIWSDDADALASIANYLQQKGWDPRLGWGIEVQLPAQTYPGDWKDEPDPLPLKSWRSLGFRLADGKKLPNRITPMRLVMPDDGSTAFLVTSNYDVLMSWNRSLYFVATVGLLSDAIQSQE